MNKQRLAEARDNAEAARLNLETFLEQQRPGRDLSGTLRNAHEQLGKAYRILSEAMGDPDLFVKPAAPTLPRITWTRMANGIEMARLYGFDLYVSGTRGHWAWSVHREGVRERVQTGEERSKDVAKNQAVGWADQLHEEDEREAEKRLNAPVTYPKLEVALEKARAEASSAKRSCMYNGDKPATFDDVDNLIDAFVATLVHSLNPEP